jgi:UDP-N-acetylmuramoyl-L-alanyl-D-glutamate--2,6-diaminopimelate ligase
VKLETLIEKSGLELERISSWQTDVDIHGLALDSRKVQAGDLFAALPGEKVHGRAFIAKALANGAAAILTDAPIPGLDVPVLLHPDPHQALAKLAAVLFPGQPENLIAVTGTNGKSSVVEFLRQIWQISGYKAACIGTLGITTEQDVTALGYTTPDCIRLHQALAGLQQDGVDHCALEASSHGLVQRRMDGARFTAAGFTNLTQDHFDYHADFDDYFHAKQRLFLQLLPKGAPTLINVDDEYGQQLANKAQTAGLAVWRIGWSGEQIKLLEIQPLAAGQKLQIRLLGQEHQIILPLVGEFQAANALLALGLALHSGVEAKPALAALEQLSGVRGRMELAATVRQNVPVIVDFAHTPDGLKKLLQAIRPHTKGKVMVVFGCGGDRDPKKRSKMGAIADQLADMAIVTDDNPRSENPAKVRAAILQAAPQALEMGDRREAIARALELAAPGDAIVIAGKGHEQGQIIGTEVLPFDDVQTARELAGLLS